MSVIKFFVLAALLTNTPTLFGATQTITPSEPPSSEAKAAGALLLQKDKTRSLMMIDPKQRAQDLQQGYELLKKEKSAGKVYFTLANGSSIGNIIDLTLLSGGTLFLFRYNSPQGIQFQLIGVEEIVGIQY